MLYKPRASQCRELCESSENCDFFSVPQNRRCILYRGQYRTSCKRRALKDLYPKVCETRYNAAAEVAARRKQLNKSCQGRSGPLDFFSYRSGYVSRWGVSMGGVTFFNCFLPKAASSWMTNFHLK